MAEQMNPVIWFEIPVKDMERARAFYQAALQLEIQPPVTVNDSLIAFFPMAMNAMGAGGALIQNGRVEPAVQGTTVYFSVKSIDPVLKRIEAAGGSVCMPRQSIGQYGFMAHFKDSEGNRVALHEPTGAEGESRRKMKVMVIVKATASSESGQLPSRELMDAMTAFNEELAKAGIILEGEGLKPTREGVRVRFDGKKRTLSKGPFAETNELVAGFWVWQVDSMDEAIEWVKRCPNPMPESSEIEIRPFYTAEDFVA